MYVWSDQHLSSATQSLMIIENIIWNVMPSTCQNRSSRILIRSLGRCNKSTSGPTPQMLKSVNVKPKDWTFGREWVAWQHNPNRIM